MGAADWRSGGGGGVAAGGRGSTLGRVTSEEADEVAGAVGAGAVGAGAVGADTDTADESIGTDDTTCDELAGSGGGEGAEAEPGKGGGWR